jgi:hypothetical protein
MEKSVGIVKLSLRSIKRDAYAQVEILKKLLYAPFLMLDGEKKMKIVRKMQNFYYCFSPSVYVLRDIYI